MQSVRPNKPLLLVTVGIPGSGKSYFARRFSEMFSAPLISFDEIRYELFNDVSFSEDENAIVARIAGLQVRELLKLHKTVIIDGGHNPKVSRLELAKIAKKNDYGVLYVWVQTDENTARERSLRRSSRAGDDLLNRSLTRDEFESQARKFTAPSDYEKYVVISGRHNFPSQARIVLKKMIGPHEEVQVPVEQPKPHGRDIRPISI